LRGCNVGIIDGFMKYAVEISSRAMIYLHTKFHKDWFRHFKVVGGGIHIQTHRQQAENRIEQGSKEAGNFLEGW
jgi:hypothetical protein